MGDRALIILKLQDQYSPVAYLHWDAPQVQNYVNRLKEVMETRGPDLEYGFARLCGIIHNDVSGNLSFGVWNLNQAGDTQPPDFEKMSHGDGGVFVVNLKDYSIETYGGYGLNLGQDRPTRDGGRADRSVFKAMSKVPELTP